MQRKTKKNKTTQKKLMKTKVRIKRKKTKIRIKEEIQEMEEKGINVKGKLKEVLTEEGLLVETVDYYTRKSRRGRRPTTLMILKITVNSRTPPEEVVLGSELLQCKKVREKPTQCWKFGHPKKYCRGENMYVLPL